MLDTPTVLAKQRRHGYNAKKDVKIGNITSIRVIPQPQHAFWKHQRSHRTVQSMQVHPASPCASMCRHPHHIPPICMFPRTSIVKLSVRFVRFVMNRLGWHPLLFRQSWLDNINIKQWIITQNKNNMTMTRDARKYSDATCCCYISSTHLW